MKRSAPPRRTPLRPGLPPKRKTPVNPVNHPRQRKERARNQGPPARKAWLVMQPCVVPMCRRPGPNDPAHIHTDGTSRKADARFTVSLCHPHHLEFHAGQVSFAARHSLDLDALAAATEARWAQHVAQQ